MVIVFVRSGRLWIMLIGSFGLGGEREREWFVYVGIVKK